ncbi:porin [Candidatus Endowatersipora endosymbiont of Watersipora subatra]|uniref:porin n=1 Tax=Candidatus Endowatersipora endosymbiont of Watersipora subatra TaxID=3077946 RepID=UPI00312C8FAD
MKLKTLLLGSVAAMIAVSGAPAADSVVAEPEPIDYVKVCDMYGSGFFYIPGTETCLEISGSMRVQYEHARLDTSSVGSFGYRTRVKFDARNETDYGTLHSSIRLEGESHNNILVDSAIMTLSNGSGSLSAGYGDDFFTTNTEFGYPGNMVDGLYEYNQTAYMQYTYAVNGFSATAGIQGDDGDSDDVLFDSYVGASYSGSWGRVAATIINDGRESTFDGDVAYSLFASLQGIENLRVDGWYQSAGDEANNYVDGGEWQWGIGARYKVVDNFSVGGGYSDSDTSGNQYTIGFEWQPITNVSVEVDYHNQSLPSDRGDSDGYLFRISRSF